MWYDGLSDQGDLHTPYDPDEGVVAPAPAPLTAMEQYNRRADQNALADVERQISALRAYVGEERLARLPHTSHNDPLRLRFSDDFQRLRYLEQRRQYLLEKLTEN